MNSNAGSITTANSGGATVPANFTSTAVVSLFISNDGPNTVTIDIGGTWSQSGGLLALFVTLGGSVVRTIPQTDIVSDQTPGNTGLTSGVSDKFTLGVNGAGTLYILAGSGTWSGSALVILRSGPGEPSPAASSGGDNVDATITSPLNPGGSVASATPPQAIVFATDGTYNYYGFAPPGTAQSAAAWKVMRVLIADGTTTAWANGNANYSNVAGTSGSNLPSLSYS
jgi:hypothetical protein